MRQALFAVVLVAASFAGGAVVNGPGLRWAQATVMNRLGLHSGDDESGDPPPSAPDTPKPTTAGTSEPGPAGTTHEAAADGIPASPIPPLVIEPSPAEPGKAQGGDKDKPNRRAGAAVSPHAPEPPAVSASPTVSGVDLPALERPEPLPAAPRSDALKSVPAASNSLQTLAADAAVALAAAAAPPAPLQTQTQTQTPAPGDPTDWAGVRRALRELGVSRYGTEGEPGGRARFHCVIPLAGRRAVGQHFEAEGDDELQAARAALRRVALWRVTEAEAAGAGHAP